MHPDGIYGYFHTTEADTVIIVDVPERHHPAVTHVEGEYVDVKAEVQQALDMGAQTMKFRNDFPHKGIVTADNQPLVTVNDPAPGQVKSVHIVFTVNGGDPQTVDTMEYEVFTLA